MKGWGAGVVELGCLLSSYGLNTIVGSTPTSTANFKDTKDAGC